MDLEFVNARSRRGLVDEGELCCPGRDEEIQTDLTRCPFDPFPTQVRSLSNRYQHQTLFGLCIHHTIAQRHSSRFELETWLQSINKIKVKAFGFPLCQSNENGKERKREREKERKREREKERKREREKETSRGRLQLEGIMWTLSLGDRMYLSWTIQLPWEEG